MSRHFNLLFYLFIVQCRTDQDCPLDKTCKNNECVDPCPFVICGSRAQCKPDQHRGLCICPSGMQGNPHVACTEVGCQSNEDCAFDEKCNYQTGDCNPLCINHDCARGARCEAQNHREVCTCNYPLQGDGYTVCSERKAKKKPFSYLYLQTLALCSQLLLIF